MKFTYSKEEKLKSQKQIEQLFAEGHALVSFPLKVVFLEAPKNTFNQAAFSAPKRNFKLAVHRNRIKRQMREAYRLQKAILDKKSGKKFVFLFMYIGKETAPYEVISSAMEKLLQKMTAHNA